MGARSECPWCGGPLHTFNPADNNIPPPSGKSNDFWLEACVNAAGCGWEDHEGATLQMNAFRKNLGKPEVPTRDPTLPAPSKGASKPAGAP